MSMHEIETAQAEVIAAVQRVVDERNELRRRVASYEEPTVIIDQDPASGRDWEFFEDLNVLVISPDLDPTWRAAVLTQLNDRPELVRCYECGAPVWLGTVCGMHGTA